MAAAGSSSEVPKKVIVLVLGDVGHSPRICYHASSLASHGVNVELVGYSGSQPHPELLNNNLIRIVYIPQVPKCHRSVPRIFQLIFKLIFMSITLFWTLLFRTSLRVSIILIQNPPGIPGMIVCYILSVSLSRIKRASLIVDWHNYTYSILQQSFPTSCGSTKKGRLLNKLKDFCVGTAYRFEGTSGRLADKNICVSNAMQSDLKERWNIDAITLYDKPPHWNIISMTSKKRHELFYRLFQADESFVEYRNTLNSLPDCSESTLFTTLDNEQNATLRSDRPLLLVSSTSWTEDEDFGILLNALRIYERNVEERRSQLPRLLVVITGKGPQKEFYLETISAMKLKHVHIVTAWLSADDYPLLLACADIGVSLHTSSSGLDLPMKIVDMFGSGLPVIAKRFQAIDEQVTENVNGRLFDTPNQLSQILVKLATKFPNNQSLNDLKQRVIAERHTTWHKQWDDLLWPTIDGILKIPEQEIQRWRRFKAE